MIRVTIVVLAIVLVSTSLAKPTEVSFMSADGIRVFADVYASADGPDAPTILLFHQAGGDARGEYTHIAVRLLREGYNVMAIDQRTGGDRFGGVNRTMAALGDVEFDYCDAYPDLIAEPGVHGSSMLSDERVKSSTEATWNVVLEFLESTMTQD